LSTRKAGNQGWFVRAVGDVAAINVLDAPRSGGL